MARSKKLRTRKDLPVQRFIIRGFKTTGLTAWEKLYRCGNAKGCWKILGYASATNPWTACRRFKEQLPEGGMRYRCQAIATYQSPQPDAPVVHVIDKLDGRYNSRKKNNRRMLLEVEA